MYKALILRNIIECDGQCWGTLPLKVTHNQSVQTHLVSLLCHVMFLAISPMKNKCVNAITSILFNCWSM